MSSDPLPSLVVATSNQGKQRELVALLDGAATIIPLSTLGLTLPEETGTTFEENASAKARFVAARTGLLALADDSGLEVAALHGAPGVRTARYAGAHATDEENRNLLLERMLDVPPAARAARFVCVLAIADANGAIATTTGFCAGSIAEREVGSGGFGYDPLFRLADGRTLAELTAEHKNAISHRGAALRSALPILLASLPSGTLQLARPRDPGGQP